jgi:hypothetical protein
MTLLYLLGTAVYFILPLLGLMKLLKINDYKICKWDVDIPLVGWGIVFVELCLYIQILIWIGVINAP